MNFNQSILKQVLQNTDIVCFTKPSEAINYAKANTVDLAFVDIEIGKISGFDVCRKLQKLNKNTKIIYLTAFMDYSFDAWSTGASGFMLKPLEADSVKTQLSLLGFR